MHYYEKLLILVVLFLGVTIGTAGIIGVYANSKNKQPEGPVKSSNNAIIIGDVRYF